MNQIFCPRCDFKSLGIDFSRVTFEGAILRGTQWNGLTLEHANFHNALLEQANFTGSHLQGADFSQDEFNMNRQRFVEANALRNINPAVPVALYMYDIFSGTPNFTCADLRSTNFTNYPVLVRMNDLPPKPSGPGARATTERDSWPMVFHGADIAGADFESVREIVIRELEPKQEPNPYESLHKMQTPQGLKYTYYTIDIPLRYLAFDRPGPNRVPDEEREKDRQALALSFVDAKNYDQAKLPPGVVELIRAEAASRPFRFKGCGE